jgi:hypothetical protein
LLAHPLTRMTLGLLAHPLTRMTLMLTQGDGGESPGGANTHEGKVRQPGVGAGLSASAVQAGVQQFRFVVPLPGSDSGGPASAGAARNRGYGKTSEATAESRSRGAGKGQERRGPERGTAGREEQDPEGRTPWMLGGRRTVIRRAGSKSSRGYSNPEGGRCRELELPGQPDLLRWHVS